jgi:hypothetical protein
MWEVMVRNDLYDFFVYFLQFGLIWKLKDSFEDDNFDVVFFLLWLDEVPTSVDHILELYEGSLPEVDIQPLLRTYLDQLQTVVWLLRQRFKNRFTLLDVTPTLRPNCQHQSITNTTILHSYQIYIITNILNLFQTISHYI